MGLIGNEVVMSLFIAILALCFACWALYIQNKAQRELLESMKRTTEIMRAILDKYNDRDK